MRGGVGGFSLSLSDSNGRKIHPPAPGVNMQRRQLALLHISSPPRAWVGRNLLSSRKDVSRVAIYQRAWVGRNILSSGKDVIFVAIYQRAWVGRSIPNLIFEYQIVATHCGVCWPENS